MSEDKCCCGAHDGDGEHKCGCGGHGGDGEHKCGCGAHDGDGEHKCGCGAHDGDGEHKCGCGGHGGDGEHKCGCGAHGGAEENNGADDDFNMGQDVPLPKPTLITFATTIAQQAMVAMGIIPHPVMRKSVFMLNQATFLIDTIDLILAKTEGNRTEEETTVITNMIHELRMLYIAAMNEKDRREKEGA